MIEPPPPAIMRGKAARLSRNEPVRLTASTRSQSARLVSRTVPLGSYGAAPLTRISNRPKASCAAATAAWLSDSTATSQRRAIVRPPACWTRRAVSSADRRSMSQHATAAPTSTNAREIARPIPPPAPLTRATLPVSAIELKGEGHAVGRGERGEVDDTAAPCATHGRHRRFAAVPNSFDIDRHRSVPIRLGDGIEAAAAQRAIEGGIVDQRVDMSECPGCRGRHAHSGSCISDVERDSDRFCALCLHQAERRRAVIDIGGDDVCPCRRQASREFLPDAAGSAGDDDNLVANIHGWVVDQARPGSNYQFGARIDKVHLVEVSHEAHRLPGGTGGGGVDPATDLYPVDDEINHRLHAHRLDDIEPCLGGGCAGGHLF